MTASGSLGARHRPTQVGPRRDRRRCRRTASGPALQRRRSTRDAVRLAVGRRPARDVEVVELASSARPPPAVIEAVESRRVRPADPRRRGRARSAGWGWPPAEERDLPTARRSWCSPAARRTAGWPPGRRPTGACRTRSTRSRWPRAVADLGRAAGSRVGARVRRDRRRRAGPTWPDLLTALLRRAGPRPPSRPGWAMDQIMAGEATPGAGRRVPRGAAGQGRDGRGDARPGRRDARARQPDRGARAEPSTSSAPAATGRTPSTSRRWPRSSWPRAGRAGWSSTATGPRRRPPARPTCSRRSASSSTCRPAGWPRCAQRGGHHASASRRPSTRRCGTPRSPRRELGVGDGLQLPRPADQPGPADVAGGRRAPTRGWRRSWPACFAGAAARRRWSSAATTASTSSPSRPRRRCGGSATARCASDRARPERRWACRGVRVETPARRRRGAQRRGGPAVLAGASRAGARRRAAQRRRRAGAFDERTGRDRDCTRRARRDGRGRPRAVDDGAAAAVLERWVDATSR